MTEVTVGEGRFTARQHGEVVVIESKGLVVTVLTRAEWDEIVEAMR